MSKTNKPRTRYQQEMINRANAFFINSPNNARDARKAIQDFVGGMLIDANTYRGFRYLHETDVPAGTSFGIIFDETPARNHVYPDDSRIQLH